MKIRILTLLFTSLFLTISCTSDDLTIEEKTLAKSEQDAIVQLVSDNLLVTKRTNVSISEVKLKKSNDMYYLSLRFENIIANVLLKESDNMLRYGGLQCISEACSDDEEGCIPDKDRKLKCTPCDKGDCTKIVSGVNIFE